MVAPATDWSEAVDYLEVLRRSRLHPAEISSTLLLLRRAHRRLEVVLVDTRHL